MNSLWLAFIHYCKNNKKNVIAWIGLFFAVLFIQWYPWQGLTHSSRIALVLFVGSAILWVSEAIPLYVTAFIILAGELVWLLPALQAEKIAATKTIFLSPFFSDIILLFLGGLLISQAGSKYRIDNWLANIVLRLVGKKPANILLGLILTSAWLSMWMSNTATTAMMLIIALAIVKKTGLEKSPFAKALFIGVPFACNIGGMGTPVGSPPNAIALAFLQRNGVHIAFHEWMMLTIPMVIILLFLLWRVLLFFFPAPKEEINTETNIVFPNEWRAWGTAVIFVLAVVLWLTEAWHGLSSGTIGLFILIALLATNILNSKEFRNLSWDILFLVGGGISLGIAMKISGLSAWFVTYLPVNQMSVIGLMLLFILVGLVLTTFMSNTATANVLIPIAISIGTAAGPMGMAIALTVSASMTLPVSTPPNAIAYYSGIFELRDMIRTGLFISILCGLLIALFAVYYWPWTSLLLWK